RCTRGKWPRSRRARNNFYEISPPHVLPPPRGSGRRYRIDLRQNPRIKSPLSNPAMSALGQKRTCAAHKVMSALAQKRTCAVQLLQSHSRPKAMVRTVSGAPTLKYAQKLKSTPRAFARWATMRLAIEPTSVKFPASVEEAGRDCARQ